jgi:hypothetical protein
LGILFSSILCTCPNQCNLCSLRADVHAPIKSVSVPASISVVLIFHVIIMARQYTWPTRQSFQDDYLHVGVMPATPSINTLDWCAEQVCTRIPSDRFNIGDGRQP